MSTGGAGVGNGVSREEGSRPHRGGKDRVEQRLQTAFPMVMFLDVLSCRNTQPLPSRRIGELMARLDIPARPGAVAGQGSARAWMASRPDGKAVLFVEADGPDDLQAVLRLLPH